MFVFVGWPASWRARLASDAHRQQRWLAIPAASTISEMISIDCKVAKYATDK
jgi:hypothetical protein